MTALEIIKERLGDVERQLACSEAEVSALRERMFFSLHDRSAMSGMGGSDVERLTACLAERKSLIRELAWLRWAAENSKETS